MLASCGGGGGSVAGNTGSAPTPTPTPTATTTATPSSPCPASVQSNAPFACVVGSTLSGPRWSLSGAPEGMVIQPASGAIRWTPLSAQAGTYNITATATAGGQTSTVAFTVTATAGAADPAGIFVSPSGSDGAAGTAAAPFKTLRRAVQGIGAGQTIYLRGGEYRNSEYGQPYAGRSEGSLVRITSSGTAGAPITMRPFGNEYVKLTSDVTAIAMQNANNWVIQGLEIAGNAQSLTYDIAMSNWWNDGVSPLSGRGIVANGDRITIRDTIVHDFPGAGITGGDGSEFLNVEDNIVYNNAWWSTGGVHGISFTDLKTSSDANAAQQTAVFTGNLAFANQSLIISHVFSKGFVTLAIDEGNGLHLQNTGGTFRGRILVENNLALWNGKSGLGLNTIDGVTVRNNGFYQNAQVVDTGELSIQSSTLAAAVNNLFHPRAERITIRDFQRAYSNVGSNATVAATADNGLYAQIVRLAAVFLNPGSGDFSPAAGVPAGMGVAAAPLQRMRDKLAEYGIVPGAPARVVDAAYLSAQKARIFALWPATYSTIRLEDRDTGYVYSYAQRCQYPNRPAATPCP